MAALEPKRVNAILAVCNSILRNEFSRQWPLFGADILSNKGEILEDHIEIPPDILSKLNNWIFPDIYRLFPENYVILDY